MRRYILHWKIKMNVSKKLTISETVTKRYFKLCFQNQNNICKRLHFIVVVGLDSKNEYHWENHHREILISQTLSFYFPFSCSPFSLLQVKNLLVILFCIKSLAIVYLSDQSKITEYITKTWCKHTRMVNKKY